MHLCNLNTYFKYMYLKYRAAIRLPINVSYQLAYVVPLPRQTTRIYSTTPLRRFPSKLDNGAWARNYGATWPRKKFYDIFSHFGYNTRL